jgi:hypothetical protein
VSGPQGLDIFALHALSELSLDTLTIRSFAVQGRREDWVKSLQMGFLLQIRGARTATIAPMHDILDGSLVITDPLAKKLVIRLQRPAATHPKLDRIAIMPEYPAPGISGRMPQSPSSWERRSLTDFRELEGAESPEHVMLDPLSSRHRGLMWCYCIGMAYPLGTLY